MHSWCEMISCDYYFLPPSFQGFVVRQDKEKWFKSAVLNTANSGKFSADRTIAEYARDIWSVTPAVAIR